MLFQHPDWTFRSHPLRVRKWKFIQRRIWMSFEHPDRTSFDHPDRTSFEHPDRTSIEHPDRKSFEHPDRTSFEHPDRTSKFYIYIKLYISSLLCLLGSGSPRCLFRSEFHFKVHFICSSHCSPISGLCLPFAPTGNRSSYLWLCSLLLSPLSHSAVGFGWAVSGLSQAGTSPPPLQQA